MNPERSDVPAAAGASRPPLADRVTDVLVHELRQPLTSILLTAQAAVRMIDSRTAIDVAELRALLTEIIEVDRRAAALVEDIGLGG